jgi:hypothetical protein
VKFVVLALPVALPSVDKTTFDFSKEKIHEED